ncbi:MAG: hypothetical protein ACK5P7_07890 [Bdellovibrio sp.]|jgi:hypothetical protein
MLGTWLIALLFSFSYGAGAGLDYWEKSPALWKKLTEERVILVSAKNEDGVTQSKGAGLVHASVIDVWNFATDTEKIKNSSRFLKNFTWNKDTGQIDMQIEILSVSYRLRGTAKQIPDAHNPKIELAVHEGNLIPFTAVLEMRSAQSQGLRQGAPGFAEDHTLVRIHGTSSKDRALSWPLRVALEAVLQRTAGYLRTAVEEEKSKSN